MSAQIGTTNTFGITAPADACAVIETSRKRSVEVAEVVGASAEYVCAAPKPLVTIEATVKGKGIIDPLALVTSGPITGVKITQAKQTESNSDTPGFELTAVAYSSLD
jgi:hypothetical protein